jgi:hypothetical protein
MGFMLDSEAVKSSASIERAITLNPARFALTMEFVSVEHEKQDGMKRLLFSAISNFPA